MTELKKKSCEHVATAVLDEALMQSFAEALLPMLMECACCPAHALILARCLEAGHELARETLGEMGVPPELATIALDALRRRIKFVGRLVEEGNEGVELHHLKVDRGRA